MLPHFSYPVQVGSDGALGVLDQDSRAEVSQCVAVLLATTTRTRVELPSYGVPDLTFTRGEQLALVQQAITTWEPRATGTRVHLDIAGDGTAQLRAELP